MIYLVFFMCCAVCIVLGGVIRMIAQGLLFTRKCGKGFLAGCIPFAANIRLHKQIRMHKQNIAGMILRTVGAVLLIGTVMWQYYESMVNMTHSFGIMLGYYTPANYSTAYNILLGLGAFAIFLGFALRLVTTRRLGTCFGISTMLSIVGMFCPSLYYLVLAFSRQSVFLLNKPTKDMTSEEFNIYCALSEDE